MTPSRPRLVIVGAGVIGTMHALEGVRRGYEVVHLERDAAPRGASVRNFGLIWVSGRAAGTELELALRARQLWGGIGASCPGVGFRASGSLTCARGPDELEALELALNAPGADERGFRLLSPDEAVALAPALGEAAGDGRLLGALHCAQDAVVEPRLVPGALREMLRASGHYRFLPSRPVVGCRPHAVRDATGTWYDGELVVCCPGANAGGFLAEVLERAPLRTVRLQMLETEPFAGPLSAAGTPRADGALPVALADADSLRYYPAYEGAPRDALRSQEAIGAADDRRHPYLRRALSLRPRRGAVRAPAQRRRVPPRAAAAGRPPVGGRVQPGHRRFDVPARRGCARRRPRDRAGRARDDDVAGDRRGHVHVTAGT
jgi:FAD dependent oxidoreductase TIGR03364